MAEPSFHFGENGNAEELDDWEQMEDSGVLDQRVNEIGKQAEKEAQKRMEANRQKAMNNKKYGDVKVLLKDNSGSAPVAYKPQIKLLQRPKDDRQANSIGMGDRKPSYKSLQERQADYNEARRRILGQVEPVGAASRSDGNSSTEASPRLAQRSTPDPIKQGDVVRQPEGPASDGFKMRHLKNGTS